MRLIAVGKQSGTLYRGTIARHIAERFLAVGDTAAAAAQSTDDVVQSTAAASAYCNAARQ